MNVLYLNTHDIGRYLETYGYPVHTPNLLALSKEGMAFTHCHCASPTCSPSRGALLTGQCPHNNGLIGLSHRGFPINGAHHLAAFLHGHGYETVISGVQHEVLLHKEDTLGYEKNLNPEAYYDKTRPECERLTIQDEMAAKNACDFLKSRKSDRPFYLAVGFGCTHRAYPRVPDDLCCDYMQVANAVPSTPENRRDMAAFHIALTTVDRLCGDILSALRESGAYDDTLIFFTTDHGLPVPMMKCNVNNDGTGVSLVMRYPHMPRAHAVCDALVSQVDVFPTLCDILGFDKPDWLEGRSLLPLFAGEQTKINEAVYSETNFHVSYCPARSVRTDRFLYVKRGETGYGKCSPCNVDDSACKEGFAQAGYFDLAEPTEELYDTALDPQERNNLAARPEYADALEKMRALLSAWQDRTNDPLKTLGRVPLPETAICSTYDSYSTKTQVILPECRKNLAALRDVLQNVIV